MLDNASQEPANTAPEGAPDPGDGALTIAPGKYRSEPLPATESYRALERLEPQLESNLPAIDARDAERVAFAMWREGRTDDAIAFLEREILLERDRLWKRDAFAGRQEPHFETPAPQVIVPPSLVDDGPPKRRRKRSRNVAPVSEPVFSDASAPVIDLSAEKVVAVPADAFPERRMGRGPAIVAAIGLVIVGFAAAGNLWDNYRGGIAIEHAAPVVETAAPQSASLSVTPAQTEPSSAPAVAALPAAPAPESVAAPVNDPASAAVDESAAAADVPVSAGTPEQAVAMSAPEEPALDDSATPPDELDSAAPDSVEPVAMAAPEEPALDDSATPPDELDEAAPDSVEPVAVARLPRQRPEPPANATTPASVEPAQQVRQVVPTAPVDAPPPQPAVADLPQPFYGTDGLPARDTLTPAEYQALLERRAIAEDYVSRRRAVAEEAIPPQRRVLLRLLRR